jgi:hypothetical protein
MTKRTDDIAAWRVMFQSAVAEQWSQFRALPRAEQIAWIKRCLPKHVLDVLPHLPADQYRGFLAHEAHRRVAELTAWKIANPAIVMQRDAARLVAGIKTKERFSIELPSWAVTLVKLESRRKLDAGVIALIEAEALRRKESAPTKAAVRRAIRAEAPKVERRGRPRKTPKK